MWPGGIKEFSALFSNMNGSGSQMGSAGNLEAEASKKTDEEPKEEVVAQEVKKIGKLYFIKGIYIANFIRS